MTASVHLATADISITLPLRLVSEANARDHWQAAHRRAHEQRSVARMTLSTPAQLLRVLVPAARLEVTLTRIGVKRLDDDNLARACKAVRDGVADALGIDDGDARVRWQYAQELARTYAVRIEIRKSAP